MIINPGSYRDASYPDGYRNGVRVLQADRLRVPLLFPIKQNVKKRIQVKQ
jgi:hypothetical protein